MPRRKNQESPDAAVARVMYVEMGPERSHKKICELLGHPASYIRQIEEWSRKHGWVEKAKQHDIAQTKKLMRAKRTKTQEAIEKMDEYQAELAKGLHIKAVKRLSDLMELDNLHGRDAVALYKETAAIERIARGAATERIETESLNDEDHPIVIKAVFGPSILEEDEDTSPQELA